MDGGSAGAAGSGSSKNLEGLHIGMCQIRDCRNNDIMISAPWKGGKR